MSVTCVKASPSLVVDGQSKSSLVLTGDGGEGVQDLDRGLQQHPEPGL